jgi:hypothetical protein
MGAPHTTAATPQSIDPGSVIASALTIYKNHAAVLLGAAVVVFAVEAILVLVLGPIGAILSIIVGTFFTGMVVELVRDVQDGRLDASVTDLFKSVTPVVLPLIAVSFLAGIGIAIGFVLLIIPGLYLMTIWSVVAPVVVLERPGVFRSFTRSRELVRGYGWQVFGVIVVAFLIQTVIQNIFQRVGAGASDSWVVTAVFSAVGQIITAPVLALAVSVVYFELRDREEPAPPPPAAAG